MSEIWTMIESGIDWITCTDKSKNGNSRLYNEGMRLIELERRSGNDKRAWGASGYDGWKCGAAQAGLRHDGAIVRLSSQFAEENWRSVYRRADNVSRIDLQVTVSTGVDSSKAISRCYRQALKHTRALKKGPRVATFRSDTGGNTVYLGSRQSENFGRAYDKFAESGLEWYQNAVRFEREVKDQLASQLIAKLYYCTDYQAEIYAEVSRFFRNRGVSWPKCPPGSLFIKRHQTVSDDTQAMQWLQKYVRPTIERLCDKGLKTQVLENLNLSVSAKPVAVPLKLAQTGSD